MEVKNVQATSKKCVSFNNIYNYILTCNFIQWNNNWSWKNKESPYSDKIDMDKTLKTPKNPSTAHKFFYSIRDEIIKTVYANDFPENINFDKAIMSLNE